MAINLFDVNTYRTANADLGAAGLTTEAQLTQHFQNFGINEGRIFSLFANLSVYRSSNPDLVSAGLTNNQQLLNHLQNFGVAEGRRFSQYVDINFYRNLNGDVNQAFGGNRERILEHLRSFGINEGRSFSPFIGTSGGLGTTRGLDYYLLANSDVKQAVSGNRLGALQHLELYGINESRSFSAFVDVGYYLTNNADINQAFSGNRARAFAHLVSFGVDEGRPFSPAFNANAYLNANADLASAGINTNRKRFEHWVTYGLNDGRAATADPGNTLATALNLGSPSPGFTYFHNSVGGSDTNDYYRFTLTTARDVVASLYGLSGDLDVALIDSSGNTIQDSTAGGASADAVSFYSLGAGTYYARVYPGLSSVSSSYDLELDFLNPVDPGNTFSTAYALSDASPTVRGVIRGSVGGSDTDDYYKFNLLSSASFTATLAPFSADADLFLYNAAGVNLASSVAGSTNTDSFTRSLSAGTYYVRVQGFSSTTNYRLTLDAV